MEPIVSIKNHYCRDTGLYTISVKNELTYPKCSDFRSAYEHTPSYTNRIVLDLNNMTYIDGDGVWMILMYIEYVQQRVPSVDIVNANPITRKLFDASGVTNLINVSYAH